MRRGKVVGRQCCLHRVEWVKGSRGCWGIFWCGAHDCYSFSTVPFKLCPSWKRSCWSDVKITPAQPRENHQKMTPGSVTFTLRVNPCIIPSWLKSWQLWLSKPLPWLSVSLFGFHVAHFPCFKPLFFCLERDTASPLGYSPAACPLVAGRKCASCIRCPASCSLAESHWGHLCRHRLQACEILQRHHIPARTAHGLMHQQPPPFLQSLFLCTVTEYGRVFILVWKFLSTQWCRRSIRFGDTLLFI